MADPTGVWLHAVTRELPADGVAGRTGVGGRPLRTVEAAGLIAVVCPVDLAEFGAEPMRRNLEDLAWLEPVARAHHAAVDAVGRLGRAVPARLGTVYHGDAGVRGVLIERHAEFTAALDRVAGRDEWGVKAYAAPPPPPAAGGAISGTAYLQRRRAQLGAAEHARQAALAHAEQVHTALTERAEDARRHPPQDPGLSGQPDPMVLNGAYLVGADRAERFTATVASLAGRTPALRLQLTGPWPPYSFVGEPA
jgi:hypothetical protein